MPEEVLHVLHLLRYVTCRAVLELLAEHAENLLSQGVSKTCFADPACYRTAVDEQERCSALETADDAQTVAELHQSKDGSVSRMRMLVSNVAEGSLVRGIGQSSFTGCS